MDKKEYIVSQLARTKKKKYEQYVITRIISLLNDWDIKFVTQQYVTRPEGRALTDLYFPQLGLHVEVNESQHFRKNEFNVNEHIEEHKIREADIINATGHKIININASEEQDFSGLNKEIDAAVSKIKKLRNGQENFIPWDLEAEFNPQTYIDRGYLDIIDDVKFRTIKDACNCFGYNYAGFQRGYTLHPKEEKTALWFPWISPIADTPPDKGDWDNQISNDEEIITTKHKTVQKINDDMLLNISSLVVTNRIVFVKVRDNLGKTLYRFRGMYQLSNEDSKNRGVEIWKRIKTRVKTYSSVKSS